MIGRPPKFAGLLVVSALASVAASAEGELLKPGTVAFWSSNFDGEQSNYQAKVVAAGDDFVLFRPNYDEYVIEADDAASEMFVEFSGLFVRFCDEEMPTSEERASLAGMWPPEPGTVTEIDGAAPAKVTIEEETTFFFMGEERKAWSVNAEYEGELETYAVLDDLRMIASIEWLEGDGSERLMAINTRGAAPSSEDLNENELGTCASLNE